MFVKFMYALVYSLVAVGFCLAVPVNITAREAPADDQLIGRDFTERPALTGMHSDYPRPLISYSGMWKVNAVDGEHQVPDDVLTSLAKKAHEQMSLHYDEIPRTIRGNTDKPIRGNTDKPGTISVMQFGDMIYIASSVTGNSALMKAAFERPKSLLSGSKLKHGGTHAEVNCIRLWFDGHKETWPATPQPRTVAWGVRSGRNEPARYFPACQDDAGANNGCKSLIGSYDPKIHEVESNNPIPADYESETLQWLGERVDNPRWGPGEPEWYLDDDDFEGFDCGDQPGASGNKRPRPDSPGGKTDVKKAKPDNQARAVGSSSSATSTTATKKKATACKLKNSKGTSTATATAASKNSKGAGSQTDKTGGKGAKAASSSVAGGKPADSKSATTSKEGKSTSAAKAGKSASTSKENKSASTSKKDKSASTSKKGKTTG